MPVLLIRRGERDSEEALRLLRQRGFSAVVLNADDPGIAPFLMLDFGTAVTPTLATGGSILPGLDLIRGFVESINRRSRVKSC